MANYMTIPEVCDLLRLSERTVYGLCRRGLLAGAAKIGNQWRVGRDDLEAFLKSGGTAGLRPPAAQQNQT